MLRSNAGLLRAAVDGNKVQCDAEPGPWRIEGVSRRAGQLKCGRGGGDGGYQSASNECSDCHRGHVGVQT